LDWGWNSFRGIVARTAFLVCIADNGRPGCSRVACYADTKPFAEKMISDHQKTSSELKALVDSGKVKATLPSALDSEHQRMLDELKLKNGNDFDRSYDAIQLKAHQEAVSLFDAYSKNGDNRDLKSWAATTLPHLKEHLSMAEKLK
jgi:putative membrane protein